MTHMDDIESHIGDALAAVGRIDISETSAIADDILASLTGALALADQINNTLRMQLEAENQEAP